MALSSFIADFRARDPTYHWKLVLRIQGILFAFISIVMTAYALRPRLRPRLVDDDNSRSLYYYSYFPGLPNNYLLPWQLITLSLSLLWNLSCVIVLFVRKGRYMHPGASVAFDLLLCMGLFVTAFFATLAGSDTLFNSSWWDYNYTFANNPNYETFPNGTHYHTYSNGTQIIDDNPCLPWVDCRAQSGYYNALNRIGVVVLVAVALTCVILLFHFALFISACRYTHQRRRQGGAPWAVRDQDDEVEVKAAMLAQQIVKSLGYPPTGQEIFHMQQQEHLRPEQRGEFQDDSTVFTTTHPEEIESPQPVPALNPKKGTNAMNDNRDYTAFSQADEGLPEINVGANADPPRY